MAEQFANDAWSTLADAITDSDLVLSVRDASTFPTVPQFRLRIQNEILLVTALAGATFTVSRGQEGTIATAHPISTLVQHILTAGVLSDIVAAEGHGIPAGGATAYVLTKASAADYDVDWEASGGGGGGGASIGTGPIGSEPGSPTAGDLYLANDAPIMERYSGAAWVPWGPIHPLSSPLQYTWVWVNQGSATRTDAYGGITLHAPGESIGGGNRLIKKALPGGNYTITALVIPSFPQKDSLRAGILWRQSSDGKIITFSVGQGQMSVFKWNSPTSYNSTLAQQGWAQWAPVFLRLRDNGTNRYAEYSVDGVNFITLASEARTTFMTADEAGFWVGAENNTTPNLDTIMLLASWKEA